MQTVYLRKPTLNGLYREMIILSLQFLNTVEKAIIANTIMTINCSGLRPAIGLNRNKYSIQLSVPGIV
jgi:hypothetical protein